MGILLVEPDFPYPTKSKHRANEVHKNFVPIGLLKLGAYHKSLNDHVLLIRGIKEKKEIPFKPNKILISSLFTYWSKDVWDTVRHYRVEYPSAEILIGGIYATLHYDRPDFKKLTKQFKVKSHKGLHPEAEKFLPDYSLLYANTDYHLMHGMRGCIRRCAFCGTWRIEPNLIFKKPEEIIKEITTVGKNKVIFLDNNFFANPYIKGTLKELADLKVNNKPVLFECQSGFDGRLLGKDPELASLLKAARFDNIRIAWDHGIEDAKSINSQLKYLIKAGYPNKDISVFMIYNFNIPYEDIIKKISYCKKWGVQIVDCRYRPLETTEDGYNPHLFKRGQTENEYYIHKVVGWSDKKIRYIRKKMREHNIWVRYAKDKGLKYDKNMEKWSAINNTFKFFDLGRAPLMEKIESSRVLKDQIQLMNRIKNLCKEKELSRPSLKGLNKIKIEEVLRGLTKNNQNLIK